MSNTNNAIVLDNQVVRGCGDKRYVVCGKYLHLLKKDGTVDIDKEIPLVEARVEPVFVLDWKAFYAHGKTSNDMRRAQSEQPFLVLGGYVNKWVGNKLMALRSTGAWEEVNPPTMDDWFKILDQKLEYLLK